MPGAVMSMLDCVDLGILLRLQPHLGVLQDINIRHLYPIPQSAVLRSVIVTNGLAWGLGVSLMRRQYFSCRTCGSGWLHLNCRTACSVL